MLALRLSEQVGLTGTYGHFGPLPLKDHCRYEVVVEMVLHLRQPGRHMKNYTQFDNVRQLRTAHINQVRAFPQSHWSTLAIRNARGNYQRLGQDLCGFF